VNICDIHFGKLEQFWYLGTTPTNKNCIHEEIKSRLKSENACYHSLQNILSSSSLSKDAEIKIYKYRSLNLSFCRGLKLGLSH